MQPLSVNLEGDASHVHPDDFIEWNPPRVIPRVFPLDVMTTRLLDLCYRRVDPDGYPQGIYDVGCAGRALECDIVAEHQRLCLSPRDTKLAYWIWVCDLTRS